MDEFNGGELSDVPGLSPAVDPTEPAGDEEKPAFPGDTDETTEAENTDGDLNAFTGDRDESPYHGELPDQISPQAPQF